MQCGEIFITNQIILHAFIKICKILQGLVSNLSLYQFYFLRILLEAFMLFI